VDNQDSLTSLPIKRTWLADIVDTFLRRPNGEADIDAVLNHLMKRPSESLAGNRKQLLRAQSTTIARTREILRDSARIQSSEGWVQARIVFLAIRKSRICLRFKGSSFQIQPINVCGRSSASAPSPTRNGKD